MKCKVCQKKVQAKLCSSCEEVIQWMYPERSIDEILEVYEEMVLGV